MLYFDKLNSDKIYPTWTKNLWKRNNEHVSETTHDSFEVLTEKI